MTIEVIAGKDHNFKEPLKGKPVFEEMDNTMKLIPSTIMYWFSAGTALGLVREPEGYIEWDTDIDLEINIIKGDEPSIIKTIFEQKGYELVRTMKSEEGIIQYAFVSPLHIIVDFYFYRKAGEELHCVCDHGTLVLPLKFVEELEYIFQYPVPKPVKDYLTFRSGDWKTPVQKTNAWDEHATKEALLR